MSWSELASAARPGAGATPLRRRLLQLRGRQVQVRRGGAGPPLLVLHDVPGSSAVSMPELAVLALTHTVLAPDLPGHGGTAALEPNLSMAGFTMWLETLLAALSWPRCEVRGTGVGAVLALALASRHPERVARLSLHALPAPSPRDVEEHLDHLYPPLHPRIDGGHLLEAFHRVRRAHLYSPWYATDAGQRRAGDVPDPRALHHAAADVLRLRDERTGLGGAAARWHRQPWSGATTLGDGAPEPILASLVDSRYGQVYVRTAGTGGVPIVMLHQSPGSGASLEPLMLEFSRSRRVIVLDTLGNGESDAPDREDTDVGYYAEVVGDVLDRCGVEIADLWGSHTGALIAMEFAIRHPHRVRALAMEGITLFDSAETEDLLTNYLAPAPLVPHPYGFQLLSAWHIRLDMALFWPWYRQDADGALRRSLPEARAHHESVMQLVHSIDTWHLAYRAAFAYPTAERLPLLRTPTVIAATPADPLRCFLERARRLSPAVSIADIPGTVSAEDTTATAQCFIDFFAASAGAPPTAEEGNTDAGAASRS